MMRVEPRKNRPIPAYAEPLPIRPRSDFDGGREAARRWFLAVLCGGIVVVAMWLALP